HGCQRMICGFEADGRLTIEHYLTVFARSLGIEFEDEYKKYRLWGDPERVLEDATPCMQANGVDRDKARALVMATFARHPASGGAAPPSCRPADGLSALSHDRSRRRPLLSRLRSPSAARLHALRCRQRARSPVLQVVRRTARRLRAGRGCHGGLTRGAR